MGLEVRSLYAVVHPDGRVCWNYCDPTPDRKKAEARAKHHDDDVDGYGCKFGPHRVVEYRAVEGE